MNLKDFPKNTVSAGWKGAIEQALLAERESMLAAAFHRTGLGWLTWGPIVERTLRDDH